MKSNTGITITMNGNRVEVESDKLNLRYRNPIQCRLCDLFSSLAIIYSSN